MPGAQTASRSPQDRRSRLTRLNNQLHTSGSRLPRPKDPDTQESRLPRPVNNLPQERSLQKHPGVDPTGLDTIEATAQSKLSWDSPKPAMTERTGLQRVYLEGLEFLLGKINEVEVELTKVKVTYYQCEEVSDDSFEEYLKRCDRNFLNGNNDLRKHNQKLEVIDAEMRIVALLNQLRELAGDPDTIMFLTEYWDNIKSTTDSLRALLHTFQRTVLNRLKTNCISYHDSTVQLDVSVKYTDDISGYLTSIEKILTNTQILLKSFNGGLHQDLYDTTEFSERILVSCDLKAFPILRFVSDVTSKIETMCDLARQWIQRDETYMYDINNYIKQTRSITKRREDDLRSQKLKHKRIGKTVKSSYLMLQNNREKLQKIETELNCLEGQLEGTQNEKKCKHEEKQQKESMVDFLKITLSQTKRNYALQMKRSKLLKQVKELEQFLGEIEKELTKIEDDIVVKAQEKVLLEEKVELSEKSYSSLKCDMDKFSENLSKLEHEVTDLSGQLLQLEIIHTFKTSPEKIEEIYDRPSTVKLAPSLKEKIQRKRKMQKPS
ncbi:CAP-Gly domain-containing linker protein 1-like [Haliotis asinina]|uniref:CAP-Gly domain-containing linker protein 1-like n=1 Tax=Haliotis asinina TaxID=109174 RepID=UPI003531E64F